MISDDYIMLLLLIITIIHIRTLLCVRATPGHPVPHADILDDLLSRYLGDSYSNSALFDFILGEPYQNKDQNISAGDNLDISILDVDSVRKIINFAKKKHDNEIKAAENSRRKGDEAYSWHPYIVNKTIDLMKQTIYMTQEKVNYTRMYRKKYRNDAGYQIALLYGAAAAMLGKMESLIAQQKHLPIASTYFIWYLILYEKILACNIDITDTIEKIFRIQQAHEKKQGGKKPKSSRLNITAAELKILLEDPLAMEKYKKEHGIQF